MACCVLVPRGCLIALKGMATKQGLLCSESPLLLRRVIGKSWLPLCLHLLVYSQHTLFGLLRRFAYYPLPNLHLGDTHCSFGGVAQAVMALYYIYRLLGVWVAPIILATLDLARSLVGSLLALIIDERRMERDTDMERERERERQRKWDRKKNKNNKEGEGGSNYIISTAWLLLRSALIVCLAFARSCALLSSLHAAAVRRALSAASTFRRRSRGCTLSTLPGMAS